MEDRETPPMCKYGESKTTQIMMATVPHVTSGSGLGKFLDEFHPTPGSKGSSQLHKMYQSRGTANNS
jgi:hypothetical protein